MARHPYVAIEGAIGVGKTTLARMLQPEFEGEVVLEVFEENPFLSDFYSDRARYAFQTQIFFLLSRYRQQTTTIPAALARGSVISDYTYAKDRLFAHLNLSGDELAMYDRVYAALGAQIQKPGLIVYLRADLDVLMGRIAMRDRPYERNMDPDYIEQLRLAYDEFMATYEDATVLTIDTNELDFVKSPQDFTSIKQRIMSSLEYGTYQTQLPGVEAMTPPEPEAMLEDLENGPKRLPHFQRFHISLDAGKGFDPNPFLNYIGMSEEMGELARTLKVMWLTQNNLCQEGLSEQEAHRRALQEHQEHIQEELADCFAYLLKLSNYAGINLEKAYLEKMIVNAHRRWDNEQAGEDESNHREGE
jgi:deoxyguanosine kinase